jgi:hypothetical protein
LPRDTHRINVTMLARRAGQARAVPHQSLFPKPAGPGPCPPGEPRGRPR